MSSAVPPFMVGYVEGAAFRVHLWRSGDLDAVCDALNAQTKGSWCLPFAQCSGSSQWQWDPELCVITVQNTQCLSCLRERRERLVELQGSVKLGV